MGGSLIPVVGAAIIVAIILFLLAIKKMIYICAPNEVLIFSGRRRRIQAVKVVDGKTIRETKTIGYRLIKGGRGFRIPMLERVDRMDLTNMIIDVAVSNAYSKGGIPLGIVGVANVKIAGEEPVINNAIERFLGKPREEVVRIIKETLEGNMRGVLATLTPEEVNEKKEAFVEELQEEAVKDLQRLGVVVDTVKIQNVYDDVKYLDSIGRTRSAEIKKSARIAEANNRATARVRDAENRQQTVLRQIDVQIKTAKAEADKRIRDAITRRDAVVAEEKAKVTAAQARAVAEIEMQIARLEQVKRQLEADVMQPARAQANADKANARGLMAKVVEEGRATAEAFKSVSDTWKQSGVGARDIFLLQKMDNLLPEVLRVLHDLKVDNLTLLPVGDGSVARTAASVNEQLKAATGVDVAQAVNRLTGRTTPSAPPTAPRPPTPPSRPAT